MQSPLEERLIFHHLERRVETRIFPCELAYPLLAAIEKTWLDQGVHSSWASVGDTLRSYQIVTVALSTKAAGEVRIRRATVPEPEHQQIYRWRGGMCDSTTPVPDSEPARGSHAK